MLLDESKRVNQWEGNFTRTILHLQILHFRKMANEWILETLNKCNWNDGTMKVEKYKNIGKEGKRVID